jgi:replicative DNA helicase
MEGSAAPGATNTLYRVPPHNFEAEMALLGAILTNNLAYEKIAEFLRPEHFADKRHGRIFEAIGRLIDKGQLASAVTLKGFFEADGLLDEIGGSTYLAHLAAGVVSVINAEDYGRTIHDRAIRRNLIQIGEDVVNRAYELTLDSTAQDQIETAEQTLYNLATEGSYQADFKSFKDALKIALAMAEAAHKRDGNLAGVATHLRDLDLKLGGLHPSDLIIIAGRPGMGKTALATNIAYNAASQYHEDVDERGERVVTDGAVVGFFSLEMSAEQLATRIIAERTRISSHKIRTGGIASEDFGKIADITHELSHLPLFIDDTAGLTISQLRTRARRLKRQHQLSLVVVDYLQLLRPSPGQKFENRVQELSEITRSLKQLAKELQVPVIALSQLSRQVEQREDKHPQLSDLRESGSIEQDADVVMFVFREAYYLKMKKPPESDTLAMEQWQSEAAPYHNKAEVIIAKQRHGPTGSVELFFEDEFTKFGNLDTTHDGGGNGG